jgi:hypothetical protein
VRAFVRRPDDAAKQELNQSPLMFIESPYPSDAQQALARKDAIIRVRNAQVEQKVAWCGQPAIALQLVSARGILTNDVPASQTALASQVSALWDELHTGRPWRTAISSTNLSSFERDGDEVGASEPKYLAVIAINTVCKHVRIVWTRVRIPQDCCACASYLCRLQAPECVQQYVQDNNVYKKGHD